MGVVTGGDELFDLGEAAGADLGRELAIDSYQNIRVARTYHRD